MARSCPQHCGRLATAAIFISFGIVQLIAGIILLKSEYVYLLSGPNIWTALANIAGGGLLGLSAGVWEKISKTSPKHAIRRNILSALVASVFLLNTTTAIILILGEGNTLLSIQLEKRKTDSSATYSASEILAYAYSASVCSPVVCVVVATVFLAEMIFPKVRKSFRFRKVLEKDSNTFFSWVYKTDLGLPIPDPEIVRKVMSSRSSWSSSSSDDSSPEVVRRKLDVETSLTKGISRLPRRDQQQTVPFESNPRTRSRVSFVGDYATNDKMFRDIELGDLQNRMKTRLKRRGDLFTLSYANDERNDLNASVSSRKSCSRLVHRVRDRKPVPERFQHYEERENVEDPDLDESLSSRKISQSVPEEVQMYEISRYGPDPVELFCEGSGLGTAPNLGASISSMKNSQLVHRVKIHQPLPEDVQYYDGKMHINDPDLDGSNYSRSLQPVHGVKGRQSVSEDVQYYDGKMHINDPDLDESNYNRKFPQPVHGVKGRQSVSEDVQYYDGKMHINDPDLDGSNYKFPQPVHGRQSVPEEAHYEGNGKATDLKASTSGRKTSHQPVPSEDVQYPDVFESFQEKLRGHQSLRKTSTTTNLSQSILDPDGSFDHSNLHKTLSGTSSTGRFNVSSREEYLAGEVVPIRTGTLPRIKLPSRLVAVAAPVVAASSGSQSLRRFKTAKFKDAAVRAGTSSFKGGVGTKHRSKSIGSYPEKSFEPIPRDSRKEAHESILQLSPAHTSGYMSSGDDNLELTFGTSSDRPFSPGCSSSKKRKFRSSRRKNIDQQLKSKAEEIDDVVKQKVIKEQILSDETIEELYKMICYRRSLLSP